MTLQLCLANRGDASRDCGAAAGAKGTPAEIQEAFPRLSAYKPREANLPEGLRLPFLRSALAAFLAAAPWPAAAQVAVATYHNDTYRTGWNT